jgi:nucleoside-diphosphate-sugar epimerase
MDSKMNILITGGTGFIGSRLALRCIDAGHGVRTYGQVNTDAESSNAAELKAAGVNVTLASILDPAAVAEALKGVDVVFHLAAAQHEANIVDQVFWDVNVEGTKTLLEESIRAGVGRFVHGSTIGVYGSALDGIISETSPCRPDNIYGVTKYEGEKAVKKYNDRLSTVIIRISETYGPGDRRLLKLFKGINKGKFPLIGSGDNIHHLIFVDDLIDGFLLAAHTDSIRGETFVLAGKEPLTTTEMVKTVASVIGKPDKFLKLPILPFMMAALLMEKVLSPMGIQPPLHRRRMDFFKKSYLFAQKKSQDDLKFTPKTPFKNGALETANWYRNQGLL